MRKRLLSLLIAGMLTIGIMPMDVLAQSETAATTVTSEMSEGVDDAEWNAMSEAYTQSMSERALEDVEEISNYPLLSGVAALDVGDKMFYEIEPNDRMSLADTVRSGYTVSGTVSGIDLDYYKLTLSSKSEIKCAATSSKSSLYLGIWDKNEDILAPAISMGYEEGAYTYAFVTTLDAGTYYMIAFDGAKASDNHYMYYFETTHVHTWDTGSFNLEAETVTYTCKECGASKTENIYIDKDAIVYRICGATRYETAFKTADQFKEVLGVTKFDSVVVATGKNFADALSGSYLAYVKDAPILLTNGKNVDEVKSYIRSNLKSGGTIYLLGGTGAVPSTMETGLSGYHVKRLAGATRYETNLLILEEAGVGNEGIVVCTGKNYADSLSASAVKKPILLVKDQLTADQEEMLGTISGNEFYIIGGTGAVSSNIANVLNSYGTVERIYGSTRYETSAAVARRFFKNADSAVLAYGKNFPDGLCGGPLACSMNAPLILTATEKTTAAAGYTDIHSIDKGYVLGGSGLISDDAARTILNKSSNNTIVVK